MEPFYLGKHDQVLDTAGNVDVALPRWLSTCSYSHHGWLVRDDCIEHGSLYPSRVGNLRLFHCLVSQTSAVALGTASSSAGRNWSCVVSAQNHSSLILGGRRCGRHSEE